MALDPPRFPQAQCVLTFAAPVLREQSRDNAILQTLEQEFPNVISRPFGVSAPNAPLVLASASGDNPAQLSIGPSQAELGVGFVQRYMGSLDRVMEYLRTKLGTVVSTLNGADVRLLTAGVILVGQFPLRGGSTEAVLQQLLETQIRHDLPVDTVADVMVRLGLKVSDTYYVSLGVNNYETRAFQGVASPASPVVSIRPWEGEITDLGIQLIIDVNDRLRVRQAGRDTVLDEVGMSEILDVMGAVAAENGPTFLQTGRVSSADIEATLANAQ